MENISTGYDILTYLAERKTAVLDVKFRQHMYTLYGSDFTDDAYTFMPSLVQRDYLAFQQNEFERILFQCSGVYPPVGLGTIGLLGTVT